MWVSLYVDFGLYNDLTEVDRGAADRRPLVAGSPRVAAPFPNRARTVAWAKPASCKDGPVIRRMFSWNRKVPVGSKPRPGLRSVPPLDGHLK